MRPAEGPAADLMLASAAMGLRYARGLVRYLATPIDPDSIDEPIRRSIADRGPAFLRLLDHAVFRQPTSPYLPLLRHAGVELGDVVPLVERDGVEGALERLYNAGVRLSLAEFKGRHPIRRPGLEIEVSPTSFDNAPHRRRFHVVVRWIARPAPSHGSRSRTADG